MIIIGVGKNDNKDISEIVNNNNLPYIKDNASANIWDSWEAVNRNLFIFNKELNLVNKINLTDSSYTNYLQTTIDSLINNI